MITMPLTPSLWDYDDMGAECFDLTGAMFHCLCESYGKTKDPVDLIELADGTVITVDDWCGVRR